MDNKTKKKMCDKLIGVNPFPRARRNYKAECEQLRIEMIVAKERANVYKELSELLLNTLGLKEKPIKKEFKIDRGDEWQSI